METATRRLLAAALAGLVAGAALGWAGATAWADPAGGPPGGDAAAGTGLAGRLVWLSGDVRSVDEETVTLATSNGTLALDTRHGIAFEKRGAWSQIEWEAVAPDTALCVSVHEHADGEVHVVKAFVNATCTPVERPGG